MAAKEEKPKQDMGTGSVKIAGMTDNYAVDKYMEIFVPLGWNVR